MNCIERQVPTMFVRKCYDHKVIGNFMKKKYLALCQRIRKPEATSVYCSFLDFNELLGRLQIDKTFGVRVYFASYCITGNADVDRLVLSGYLDLMTLIFVATNGPDDNYQDIGNYYMFNPGGGVIQLDMPTAKKLFEHYVKCKVPLMEEIIINAGIPTFKETRSLWVKYTSLNGQFGFLQEAICQEAKGINIFFGTYGRNERPPKETSIDWQMTLILQLTKTIEFKNQTYHYNFDIEDMHGFEQREGVPGPCLPEGSGTFGGGNTLSPCPPATNCGTLCTNC